MADTHNLVTNTAFNTKTVEVEHKKQIPDILRKFQILGDSLVIFFLIKKNEEGEKKFLIMLNILPLLSLIIFLVKYLMKIATNIDLANVEQTAIENDNNKKIEVSETYDFEGVYWVYWVHRTVWQRKLHMKT